MANEFIKASGVVQYENKSESAPTDISDILNICKHFSQLGWRLQVQLEMIMENGVEEAMSGGQVDANALLGIRGFLKVVSDNELLGEVSEQCFATMMMIDHYIDKHPEVFKRSKN